MGILWSPGAALTRGVVITAVITAAFIRPAVADVIPQNRSFSIGGVPGTDLIGFQEFDPTLGALDSVGVHIAGTLNFSAVIPQLSALAPVVDFDTMRLTGQGYEFSGSGARFIFSSLANGSSAPATFAFASAFTLDFTVTALTDTTGAIVATTTASGGATLLPPTTVGALRNDFIEDILALGIQEQILFVPVNFSPNGVFAGGGSVTLTYDYTPAPVVAMPEPGTAALFSLALAGLACLRRGSIPAIPPEWFPPTS